MSDQQNSGSGVSGRGDKHVERLEETLPINHSPVAEVEKKTPGEQVDDTRSFQQDGSTSEKRSQQSVAATAMSDRQRGQFRIIKAHAEGGLGRVSIAHDASFHRQVALKEIRPEHADNPDSQRRFLNEAEITGQLEHPGIVPVHALGDDEHGYPYYAMKFVDGETLADAVKKCHDSFSMLKLRGLLQRFVIVCQTIAYAHSQRIIHRDLKPANIMLSDYGETLVVDWGLAKRCDAQPDNPGGSATETDSPIESGRMDLTPSPELTQAGQILGTPAYMSPEQARGDLLEVGPRSDIYALGAVLYFILAGSPPYAGKSGLKIIRMVQSERPKPPASIRRGVPGALQAICEKAMAREPKERYTTADELAGDLERWLADEPVSCHRDSLVARTTRWGRTTKPWSLAQPL